MANKSVALTAQSAGIFTVGRTPQDRRREFALLCPKIDRESDRNVELTLDGMKQLAAVRKGIALLARSGADGALISGLAEDLREAEEKLAQALFGEIPRRGTH